MPSENDLTGTPCPACGGRLVAWRAVPASEPGLTAGRYELWRCATCGSAVTAGEASPELHETGAYRAGQPRLYRLVTPLLRSFDRQRLAMLRAAAPPPRRLLDAGAGRGRFLAAALAAGYDAFGIEPSARGAGTAAALGLPVRRAGIEAAGLPAASVDVVTLWHVLEHLDNPAVALAEIARWLRPSGILLVGVPNLSSWQARAGADRWYHLDPPRHRVHFTEAGVGELLRGQGFSVVATRHLLLEHNPFGMWQSLVNRLTRQPSYLYNLLKRNAPVRSRDLAITIAALPLLPVAAAAELIAGLLHRGGTIAVLARRTDQRHGETTARQARRPE
ncbi:MAG: class I SAM-dependent methyltransferase [Actinomycetota bacterium]|nr:class I SAM-dependent methyltransferase [Actinomycetota bacterium]